MDGIDPYNTHSVNGEYMFISFFYEIILNTFFKVRSRATSKEWVVWRWAVWAPVSSTRASSTIDSLQPIRGGPSPILPTGFPFLTIPISTIPSTLSTPAHPPTVMLEFVFQDRYVPSLADVLAVPVSWGKFVASVRITSTI
jgi:hypothetical protein